MNIQKNILLALFLSLYCSSFAQVPSPGKKQQKGIAIINATIHIGNTKVIQNGVIAFENGKIIAVEQAGSYNIPEGFEKIDANSQHIYPGLIVANTDLGLKEISAVEASVDNVEVGNYNPNVRSIIAYNSDSHIIPVTRSNGVLIAQVVPQGGMISGTSSVVQLDAWNWEDAVISVDEGVHFNYPRQFFGARWWLNETKPRANKNYKKSIQDLNKFILEAKAYSQTKSPKTKNLKFEAMRGAFDGTKRVYLHVDYAKGILEGIQLLKSVGVKKVVLVSGAEVWMVKDFIKNEKIPVILRNVHSLPYREDEDIDLPYALPSVLYKEGIDVALTYDDRSNVRNLPFLAGTSAAHGLDKEEALTLVTSNPAKILGLDAYGTLEKGKSATLVISEGDIFDMRYSRVIRAFVDGRVVNLDNKHKMLYKKFKKKYEK